MEVVPPHKTLKKLNTRELKQDVTATRAPAVLKEPSHSIAISYL